MDKKAKAIETVERGGFIAEEEGENVRFRLACDPKNPLQLFDKINAYELELIKQAGNDVKKVQIASNFVDDLRARAKAALLLAGIDIEKIQRENATKKSSGS